MIATASLAETDQTIGFRDQIGDLRVRVDFLGTCVAKASDKPTEVGMGRACWFCRCRSDPETRIEICWDFGEFCGIVQVRLEDVANGRDGWIGCDSVPGNVGVRWR